MTDGADYVWPSLYGRVPLTPQGVVAANEVLASWMRSLDEDEFDEDEDE